jgi:hypothetical protein
MTKPFLMALAASAAFAQDVNYNFEPGADFAKYKTYRWMDHPKSQNVDSITKGQITQAFDQALAAKGLAKKDSGDTDLVVTWQLAISQEHEMTTIDSGGGWGYGPGWRGGWYGGMGMGGVATTTTNTVDIGTVVLDMYDASNKHLIWRGKATKQINENEKPDKRQKNLNKGAAKMLKNYPPKQKK